MCFSPPLMMNMRLKAFEVNALDYLLKPVEPKRLADAIQKLHYQEKKKSFQIPR
jgi:two-component system LytT family response regulator